MSTASRDGEAPVTGASYAGFLGQLPFFVGVPADDLASFASTVLLRELPAGADVVVQRQYGHAMFVIVSGAVAIRAVGADDNLVELGRLDRPGEFFGEAVLLGRGERTATVTGAALASSALIGTTAGIGGAAVTFMSMTKLLANRPDTISRLSARATSVETSRLLILL